MVALASAFIRLRPTVDRVEFAKAGAEAGRAAQDGFNSRFGKDLSAPMRDAKGVFAKAGADLGDESGKAAGVNFAAGFTRDATGRLKAANARFATDAQKAAVDSGAKAGDGFGRAFKRGSDKSFGKGQSVFGRVAAVATSKFALIGAGAVLATPGVLRLTAALLPAAGALTALPAAVGGLVAAQTTLKIAVAGVGDAVKAGFTGTAKQAKKTMDALPPSAQKFAAAIIGLKPQVEALRQTVAQRFFAPMQKDIKPLVDRYFPMLRAQMAGVSGSLGGLGGALVGAARKADVFAGVRDLFTATRLTVDNLRGAVAPLVTSFGVLIQSTAPELPRLASGFTTLAQRVAGYVTNAVDSGRVNAVYDQGIATLRDLGGIVGNVGSIFRSVFAAANAGGNTLLSNLRAVTGQAAAFLKSVQGVGALQTVFGTLDQLSAGLRTSLGAVLPAIGQALQALGPAIGGLGGPFSQLVVAVAPLLPAFAGIAATVITRLTPAISALAGYLAQHTGLVKAAAVAITAYMVAVKVAAAAAAVQAAGGLMAWFRATTLVTAATRVAAVAQTAFGVALRFALGPIGLIITAVGLISVALVYLFNHNKTFHDFVIATWNGIKAAVAAVGAWFTGTLVPVLVAAWHGIAAGALWLWHNVFQPVWHGIQSAVSFAWNNVIKPVVNALVGFFRNVIAPTALWLWHNVFQPVFTGIGWVVHAAWVIIQIALKAFQIYLTHVVFPVIRFLYNNVVKPIFSAIGATISWLWNNIGKPMFNNLKAGFSVLGSGIKAVWDTVIKPVLNTLGGFIKNTVAPAFGKGVDAIKNAWDKVKDAAKAPVKFVVDHIINPFVGGINAAAAAVGVKDRIPKITGLRDGGLFTAQPVGHATGGKISGAGGITDNRQALIPGVGAVQLQGGEYVVNRQSTAKALPLLKWVNAGMQGGPSKIASYLGRPVADMPGDGSEGWAFKDGGLIGWVKDVWGAISHPAEAIKQPFEAVLSRIPGAAMIKDFLVGSAHKLLDGAVGWISKVAGGGGKVGDAVKFLHSADGKPYGWANAGPDSWDCSGIVSSVFNVLHGKNPYGHTFSTESASGFFPKDGPGGPLTAAWSHPGEAPASASVGHMMGRVGNLTFESTGSRGVHLGNTTRNLTDFANIGHYAHGGLVPFRLFDDGGAWPTGTVGYNRSGHTEQVLTGGPNGDMAALLSVLTDILTVLRGHPGEIADALERPTRRAVQLGRGRTVRTA